MSNRASARSRVRAWGALRAKWRKSSGVWPQRARSTRITKSDHLRRRVIRWEQALLIQARANCRSQTGRGLVSLFSKILMHGDEATRRLLMTALDPKG